VELYNQGTTPAQLDGWSLQLTGGSGTQWTVIPLKGTIPAKGYYLIALAGGDYAYDLPKADASGSYDLAAKQGKVALLRTTTPLAVASPLGLATLNDLVGYGSANAYEGAYPAIAPERYYAIFRADAGATDTNDNYRDFDWNYAAPRNSATPVTLRKKTTPPQSRPIKPTPPAQAAWKLPPMQPGPIVEQTRRRCTPASTPPDEGHRAARTDCGTESPQQTSSNTNQN